ncbi:MAG TPA: copper homeostasis protein CutC [Nocardioidaceae bacterium]|nr:copper homeostasis protein CutC [Nocardioidaceae bacterium]
MDASQPIDEGEPMDDCLLDGLLEVVVLHLADAEAAQAGGADRVEVCVRKGLEEMSPAPTDVRTIVRGTDLAVRVVLRLSEGFGTTGGEVTRLSGLAGDYLSAGADGVAFGFLNADLDIDLGVCAALVDALDGASWTLHRVIDHTLDTDRAWRQLRALPGLDSVLTAGSALGVDTGKDDLERRASADPEVARLMLVGGGLQAEHVPWLLRAGIRKFHLGSSVRPDGSWDKAYVDPAFVRSWRTLVDDHVRRLPSA